MVRPAPNDSVVPQVDVVERYQGATWEIPRFFVDDDDTPLDASGWTDLVAELRQEEDDPRDTDALLTFSVVAVDISTADFVFTVDAEDTALLDAPRWYAADFFATIDGDRVALVTWKIHVLRRASGA